MTENRNTHFKTALLFLGILIAIVFFANSGNALSAEKGGDPDVGLWLARSCIGEAKWDSVETTECASLMHIYLKRSVVSNGKYNLYEIIRKYSAATKNRKDHPRKWIFDLNRDSKRPARFPQNLNWKWKHKPQWKRTLKHADDFLAGKVPDPTPNGDHYGSDVDHHRAMKAGWFLIPTRYRNNIYSVDRVARKIKE